MFNERTVHLRSKITSSVLLSNTIFGSPVYLSWNVQVLLMMIMMVHLNFTTETFLIICSDRWWQQCCLHWSTVYYNYLHYYYQYHTVITCFRFIIKMCTWRWFFSLQHTEHRHQVIVRTARFRIVWSSVWYIPFSDLWNKTLQYKL